MDQTALLHMLRTGTIGSGILMTVSMTLAMLVGMPLMIALTKRREGPLTTILGSTMLLGMVAVPMGGSFYIVNQYIIGEVESIFIGDGDDVSFMYKLRKYHEDYNDEIYFRLHKRSITSQANQITELTHYEDRSRDEVWYHRFEDQLFVCEERLARIMSLKDNAVTLDHTSLAKRQPALAGAIKPLGVSADGATLWFEDAGGLSYRLELRTLEATRERPPAGVAHVTPAQQRHNGLGWMPSQSVGCEDKQRMSTEPVKDAPRRANARIGQETTLGDGWLALTFLEDRVRDCAIQPSPAGGAIVLAHDALEHPNLLIAGVDPQGQQLWSIDTGWSGNTQLAVMERLDDGAILLVNVDGDAALLDPAAGKLRWSVRGAEQARWWGAHRDIAIHHISANKETLTLWLVEDKVTPHLVRRALKDGALLSSRGF